MRPRTSHLGGAGSLYPGLTRPSSSRTGVASSPPRSTPEEVPLPKRAWGGVSSSAYSRERVEVTYSDVRTVSAQHPCHRGCPNDTKRFSKTRLTTGHHLTLRPVAGCATGSTRPSRCPRAGRASRPLPLSLATGSINSWSVARNPMKRPTRHVALRHPSACKGPLESSVSRRRCRGCHERGPERGEATRLRHPSSLPF